MKSESEIYQVGDYSVTKVEELVMSTFTPEMLFPQRNPGVFVEHANSFSPGSMDEAREHVLMSVHTWVVKKGDLTILIDTGVGNGKNRPCTPVFDNLSLPYLDRLDSAGVKPEQVDYVLLTHLHVDHVGWNTQLVDGKWVPTFPNARYLFPRVEFEYFTDEKNDNERNKTSFIVQKDSVIPIIDAGAAQMIEFDGKEAIPDFVYHKTAGHSVGHSSISLISGEQFALFCGDILHNPVQVHRPGWNSMFDAFPEDARRSRYWALNYAAENEAIVFTSHLPQTSVGYVTTTEDAFRWEFV